MSGDLISRQDAIDAVLDLSEKMKNEMLFIDAIVNEIENLPSAEPERKTGEWIEYPDSLRYEGAYADDQIVCSECHHVFSIMDNCTEEFDFCPHCGADMRGNNGKA